jgi:predicted small secreted protein
MAVRQFERYPLAMKFCTKPLALLLLAATFFAFAGTGCNTANGVGKDVEKLGDKIQEKSGK